MNRIMKVVVVCEFGKLLVIEEVVVLCLGVGEVLVRIEVCGVCYIDLYVVEGDWLVKLNLLFIFGYEGVGYVVVVGGGVGYVKEGDRVGIFWLYLVCGYCEYCLGGWEMLCEMQCNIGYLVNGGFVEYVLVDVNYVGLFLKDVGFVEIVLVLCVGVIVYKGLKVIDIKFGDWVVIFGIGGLGYMVVQYVCVMGLNVVVVDVDDMKFVLVCQLGVQVIVNVCIIDLVVFLKKEIGGVYGVLVMVVLLKVFEQVLGMVCCGGIVLFNGLLFGNFLLDIFGMVFNGIIVCGLIVGIWLDLQELLQFVVEGKVVVMVSIDCLENINDVFVCMYVGIIEGCVVFDFVV